MNSLVIPAKAGIHGFPIKTFGNDGWLDSCFRRNDALRVGLVIFVFFQGSVLFAAVPAKILIERAEKFKTLGLIPLAREQYMYVKKEYPKEKSVAQALEELSGAELKIHESNALNAENAGALKLAALEYERALKADPSNQRLKGRYKGVMKEINLKQGLNERVSKEYLRGLEFYQAGKLDQALESFVTTLNMAPQHKGALNYVEKIGEKLGKGKTP